MLLCYVTDRKQLSPGPGESLHLLLEAIANATRAGLDLIQLREKDLTTRELVELGTKAAEIVRKGNTTDTSKPPTRLLINSRLDVAIACGAHGVQLRADDISAADARGVFSKSGIDGPLIGVSCHRVREIELAEGHGADFALFGPIFEKAGTPRQSCGVGELEAVCRNRRAIRPPMPVLAIGGVNAANVLECLQAGAGGIAAIRLFQSSDVIKTVSALRRLAA